MLDLSQECQVLSIHRPTTQVVISWGGGEGEVNENFASGYSRAWQAGDKDTCRGRERAFKISQVFFNLFYHKHECE